MFTLLIEIHPLVCHPGRHVRGRIENELPVVLNPVVLQDISAEVITKQFEVVVVFAIPPIEQLFDLQFSLAEVERHRFFVGFVTTIAFDPDSHTLPSYEQGEGAFRCQNHMPSVALYDIRKGRANLGRSTVSGPTWCGSHPLPGIQWSEGFPKSIWILGRNKEVTLTIAKADLRRKYLGCMIGSGLGDAIGEIAFQYPEKERLCIQVEGMDQLRYTDDTAMAIGLAESLQRVRRIDQEDLGDTFSRNYTREPWRGDAMGPPAIFARVQRSGVSYIEAARALFGGSGSFGNGAAMRIAPVGLVFHRSPDLYSQACASAEVTHAHPIGMDGAAVQALAIATATSLPQGEQFEEEKFIRKLIEFARTREIQVKMRSVHTLLAERVLPDVAAESLGRSVAVHESMPFAIYAFLKHPKSFEGCLFCAVLNGGDRDTLGAMAGAISGAYLGIEAIPPTWREKLENAQYIAQLAESLADG